MAKILDVKGRRVWDSRGRPTVEAEVIVGRGSTPLASGRAIAPAGASTGSGEAKAIDVPSAGEKNKRPLPHAPRAPHRSGPKGNDERRIDPPRPPDKNR